MSNVPIQFNPISGYLGLYDAGNDGSIRSLPRMIKGKNGLKLSPGCILKGQADKNTGYLRVVLCKNGKTKNYSIHRLVAETFIENTHNLPQVNHVNGDKRDNHADNLEWISHKGNMEHASRHGLVASGTRQRNAKLTDEAVKTIFTSGDSLSVLASKHGVSPQTISHIKNRATWKRATANLYRQMKPYDHI